MDVRLAHTSSHCTKLIQKKSEKNSTQRLTGAAGRITKKLDLEGQ
jgi:hypothetical protein